jgi:hypothetical protein
VSYQKICLTRAVRLDPENINARRAWETMIYHRIRDLVDKNILDTAIRELYEAEDVIPIQHTHLNVIFACVLLESGQVEKDFFIC